MVLSWRSLTQHSVVSARTLVTFDQNRADSWRFSMMYPVIGEPPSSDGAFHLMLIAVRWTSVTVRGPIGLDGTTENMIYILYKIK
uniref:Uncharacterized protein n=1 Tax=Octopus bimaculoides TaxID=37653 RepID=A0A0L8IAN3_OCTBM